MAFDAPPLTDVAAMLRFVADQIEEGERFVLGGTAVLILDGKDGRFSVQAFGDADSALAMAALGAAVTDLGTKRLNQCPA